MRHCHAYFMAEETETQKEFYNLPECTKLVRGETEVGSQG